jgi:hypothetical protein
VQARPLTADGLQEALATPGARGVIAASIRQPLAVRELSAATGIPMATTYRIVHRLVELGVLVVERSAMTADGKAYDLYRSRISAGRLEVTAAGTHVAWNPNLAVEERIARMWNQIGR